MIESFEKDRKLVYTCGISPAILPELIEKNPVLTSHILFHLHQSQQITS